MRPSIGDWDASRSPAHLDLARGIDQAVNAGTVLVRQKSRWHPIVEARPGEAAVVAARHRSGVATVADGPDGKDGLAVGQEEGGRMALVDRVGAGGDDGLAPVVAG